MKYHLAPDPRLYPPDKFTDSAIAMNSKVNGEHKEKVLQRWEGGDSNSDDYDLESDMVGAAPAEPARPLLLGGGRHWRSAHSWSPRASGEGRKTC